MPATEPVDIVVATGNLGKLAELREMLGPGYRVVSAAEAGAEMPNETGETFAENAKLKARAVAEQTGKIAIADDSGLEVSALGGSPGVRTARYAGAAATDAQNREKLLKVLQDVGELERQARFVSVIAIALSPEEIITTRGICEGTIALEERGEGGFGYDSIFQTPSGKTMAELEPAEKNRISHRGQAMRMATRFLADRLHVSGSPPEVHG
ncbi:MAG TPA: RdgB/HAM1 family non-canonical purine NTP pyrophosphatase [Thermomicrobiales bacterium]|nr:RdgB/HAM1 family non-canonical purine NTP pyrophosphatase [Thermomicrobiales bacterium]